MNDKEAFEAWAIRNTSASSAHDMAWAAWQAATAAERERAARIAEKHFHSTTVKQIRAGS